MKMLCSALLASCLGLAACAGGPVYRPAPEADAYGYRDMAITADRYRVSFAGGYRTARETVENLALYRAAEVALAEGFETFRINARETESISSYSGPSSRVGYGFGYPFWGTSVGFSNARSDTRYETVLEIQVGPDLPDEGRDIYDAREIKRNLSALVAATDD